MRVNGDDWPLPGTRWSALALDPARSGTGASEDERFAVEALLAAVVQLVTARLAVGDVDGLRRLHSPLVSFARRLGVSTSA